MGIRVLILRPDLTRAYDVTDRIEGLQWSNVNPGGHERAAFMLKGSWGAGFPEARRGNIVRIEDGGQELFTGRIDEQDPQAADAEQVSITAYGLGVRLKDDTMREIYVDRDVSKWRGPSLARKIAAASGSIDVTDMSIVPDTTNGQSSLALVLQGAWSRTANVEAVYDAHGIPIGALYYSWKVNANINPADANWSGTLSLYENDTPTAPLDGSGDLLSSATSGTGTLTASTSTKIFVYIDLTYGVGAGGANVQYGLYFPVLAVYGKHGLTKRGANSATDAQGFYASDIVADVCSRLAAVDIAARRIDQSTFIIPQLVFFDDTTYEDVITEVSKYQNVDWGVWGPDLLTGEFSDPMVGYLDWTARDSSTISWIAYRDECEELDLHTELGSTYDQVAVSYTDPTGQTHRVLRSIDSPALDDAGIVHRTAPLQGGTLTLSGAQQLGDAFLALSSGNPVSRGQAIIKGSIKHNSVQRPVHFLRADGSNLTIPDAFSDRDSFALDPLKGEPAVPQPVNPSADVNASGWTAVGTTSIVRDTVIGNFDSAPGAIEILQTDSAAGQGADATITGTFLAGVTYTLRFAIKGFSAIPVDVTFGSIAAGDVATFSLTTASANFVTYAIQWTPTANRTDAVVRVLHTATGATNWWVDSLEITVRHAKDRGSTFPIKRVSVDCSGDEPVATVELDQSHDLLSILLARLQVATGLALGGEG